MEFTYDREADAVYVRVLPGEITVRTEEIDPGTLVDLGARGQVVGIEIIHPARPWPVDAIEERFSLGAEAASSLRSFLKEPGSPFPFVRPLVEV